MFRENFAHHPRTLLHIAPYLRRRSIPPADIFKRADISPVSLLTSNGWVPRELCFRLGAEILSVTGDRYLGAEIGRSFELSHLGSWGATVGEATTLRQALNIAIKGIHLLHRGTNLQLVGSKRWVKLCFAFAGRSGTNPQQHILGALAVFRRIALLAGVPEAVGAHFSQPYELGADQLEETFGSQLSFGCDDDGIIIDRAILSQRLPANIPKKTTDPMAMPAALCALVEELLPYETVTADFIAAHVNMSTRTLQRRLSFEEIVDDVRRTEAIRRILAGADTAAEITFMLGYSDQAHFYRAFRRWTGLTPREYKARFAAIGLRK